MVEKTKSQSILLCRLNHGQRELSSGLLKPDWAVSDKPDSAFFFSRKAMPLRVSQSICEIVSSQDEKAEYQLCYFTVAEQKLRADRLPA